MKGITDRSYYEIILARHVVFIFFTAAYEYIVVSKPLLQKCSIIVLTHEHEASGSFP